MNRKQYLALALVIALPVLAYAVIQVAKPRCVDCFTPTPPLVEQEDEPSIPPARFEKNEPIEVEIPKPAPLPDIKIEEPLPEGAICLADCPLIEVKVEETFGPDSVMLSVARCESTMRHWDESGNVLRNKQGSSAVGVFQIMASYHEAPARDLGYDITTLEGNIGYAEYLYHTQGLQPWYASENCWRV